jgi:hypothetical protein
LPEWNTLAYYGKVSVAPQENLHHCFGGRNRCIEFSS